MTPAEWNEQVVAGCHRSYGIPMLTASQRRERDAMLDRERLATRLAFADHQALGSGNRAQPTDIHTDSRRCAKPGCGRKMRVVKSGSPYCAYHRRGVDRRSSTRLQ